MSARTEKIEPGSPPKDGRAGQTNRQCIGKVGTLCLKTRALLTVNYDLGLLALCGVDAGDVAAVAAGVGDVDPVDGQDASSLCGLGQNFPVGLQVYQAVCLVGKKRCESQIFIHKCWAAKTYRCHVPVCSGRTTGCQLLR